MRNPENTGKVGWESRADERRRAQAARVKLRREEIAREIEPLLKYRSLRPTADLKRYGKELPPIIPRKSPLYMNMLEIQQWPGDWFQVWVGWKVSAAKKYFEKIIRGDTAVPVGEYEMEVRSKPNPKGSGWPKLGQIVAKYEGGRAPEEWAEEWRMLHP